MGSWKMEILDSDKSLHGNMNPVSNLVQLRHPTHSRLISLEYIRLGDTRGIPLIGMLVRDGELSPGERELPYYLHDIRSRLSEEKTHCVPTEFRFLSSTLARVREKDEGIIAWHNVCTKDGKIFLSSVHELEQCFFFNQSKAPLGSLSAALNSQLPAIREEISTEILAKFSESLANFVRPNGTIVAVSEEQNLCLLDISDHNRQVVLRTQSKQFAREDSQKTLMESPSEKLDISLDKDESRNKLPDRPFVLRQPSSALAQRKQLSQTANPLALDRQISLKSRPLISPLTRNVSPKKFLISYVSSEAKCLAAGLKKALEMHGCSVFLDVDSIVGGMDWQDMLNEAVQNCEVFVPLITESYGLTVWTNREVKMADLLQKVIVPVSFIDTWPPMCLAIQFSSTQYIRWRNSTTASMGNSDEKNVVEIRTRATAGQIIALYRDYLDNSVPVAGEADFSETPPLLCGESARKRPRRSTLRSYPHDIRRGRHTLAVQEAKKPKEGRPLVVVIAHPSQKVNVERLREEFTNQNLDLWSTSEDPRMWPESFYGLLHFPDPTALSPVPEDNDTIIPRLSQFSASSSSSATTSSSLGEDSLFREKADEAGVVILLLSAALAASHQCKKFLHYVEHRKLLIFVKMEDFAFPGWISLIIGSKEIQEYNSADFLAVMKTKLKRVLLGQAECSEEDLTEVSIQREIEFLKNRDVARERSVLITGYGSGKKENYNELIRAIVGELAKLPRLLLVTEGNNRLVQLVNTHFCSARKALKYDENFFHILPRRTKQHELEKDNSSITKDTKGTTFFVGESIRQTEIIVGRYFRVCIVIDGDCHAEHIATESLWAENIVLPVGSRTGLSSSDLDSRLQKPPMSISEIQWATIRSESQSAQVAETLRQIIETLLPNVLSLPESKTTVKRGAKRKPGSTPLVVLQDAPRTPASPCPYGLRDRKLQKRRIYQEIDEEQRTPPDDY